MRDLAQNNCDLQVVIEYKPRGPRTHMLLGSAAKTILGIHRMNVANFGGLQVFGHALFGGESSPESAKLLQVCRSVRTGVLPRGPRLQQVRRNAS